MSSPTNPSNEPVLVIWPPSWPFVLVGLVPFAILSVVAWWYPLWALLIGLVVLPLWFGRYGGVAAHGLDFWLRTLDFILNRTYAPPLPDSSPWQLLKSALTSRAGFRSAMRLLCHRGGLLNGYSLPIVIWTTLMLWIVLYGPTRTPLNYLPFMDTVPRLLGSPAWSEFCLGVAIMAAIDLFVGLILALLLTLVWAALASFTWKNVRLHGVITLALGAAILVNLAWPYVISLGEPAEPWTEAAHFVYPHVFLLFIAVALALTWVARLIAPILVRSFTRRFAQAWHQPRQMLGQVELFVQLPRLRDAWQEDLGFVHNFRSAIATPLRYPHLLVYPIAVAVLMGPSAYMNFMAVATGLFAWTVLALAGNHPRLSDVLTWLQRLFFDGVLWVVSLLLIVLAACRFADISYVATITNSASSLTLAWFLISIYVALWFYKYWVGSILSKHMLGLLADGNAADGPVPYQFDGRFHGNPYILPDGRFVQAHGAHIAVVGTFENKNGRGQAWEVYDPVGLFEAIARKQPSAPTMVGNPAIAAPGHPEMICKPADADVLDQTFGLSDLRQRVFFYHICLDVILFAVVVAYFVASYTLPDPIAELTATKEEPTFSFADRLFLTKEEEESGKKPKAIILFAGSGGGTRAALYSAAVLRGLDDLGALENVELCSGVSGGSAAIAHFAVHRDNLMKSEDAWNTYADVMTAPFIDDVLCGTLEARMSFGTRMGALLDESLHRQIFRGEHPRRPVNKGMTLKEAKLGIIFNSTLAGSGKVGETPDPSQAGSRLIVTNVPTKNAFPSGYPRFPSLRNEYLHYVVVNDPEARLTTGAALSANFPPVFSNALVDVTAGQDKNSYWVTDGGAAENRGAISLLYVLRRALREESELREEAKKAKKTRTPRTPRPVQIVIAEASAVSLDFSQDRGLSSALGAAEKFASELTQELLAQISDEYRVLDGKYLDVHFIPMPLVLRSRGGVGTHWKLPAYIRVESPMKLLARKTESEDTVVLSGEQTRRIIMDLFLPAGSRYPDKEGKDDQRLQTAWRWIEGLDAAELRYRQHRENWDSLKATLAKLGYTPKKRD